jgi:type II secretory pathway component PulC
MFGKKAISPEEKLLRIIEQPKAKAAAGIALKKGDVAPALGNLRDSIGRFNLLDLTNRLLFGAAVISTVLFIFAFLRPTPLIKSQLSERTAKLEIQKAADLLLPKQNEYLQTIIRRNMFEVTGADGVRTTTDKRAEQLGLKLVGIITIDKDRLQAIIEDKDGRTYLGNPDETIFGSFKIEKIEADRVTLKRGEEILELK